MSTPVRTCVVQTGEVMINVNDLIINLMIQAENVSSQEADHIRKIIDYLVAKREKAHAPH